MCLSFQLELVHWTTYILILYYAQDDRTVAQKTDNVLPEYLPVSLHILTDLIITRNGGYIIGKKMIEKADIDIDRYRYRSLKRLLVFPM